MEWECYVSLGANLGDRERALRQALEWLHGSDGMELCRVSGFFETAPWGKLDQPPFVNAAAKLRTEMEPLELLETCQRIEKDLGRVRHEHWGARTMDIDLLHIPNVSMDTEQLHLPHPHMLERAFVLVPLAEIASGLEIAGKTVKEHLLASLDRLQTDYVDIYYLHRTHGVSVEKVAEAMGRLIDDGLIRSWGLSQVDVDVIDRAHRITPLAAIQNIYSMVERDSEAEIIPYCIENNIGFVPFSPIASSLLSGKITPQTQFERNDDVRNWVPQLSRANIAGNQPIVEMLIEFAQKKDATPAQISLAWMLYKYPNVVPIPGSKNKERIVENLNSSNVELTDEEFTALEESLNALKVYGHRGLGGF